MSRRFRTFTTIAVLHTSVVLTPNLHAQPFSEIVAFGASLTDSGNIAIASPAVFGHSIPVSPPYFMGRFTNGPSWLDVLADSLDVDRPLPSESGGTNYAWGGATIGTAPNGFEDLGLLNLDEQVSSYLSETRPSGDELFVLAAVAATGDFANGQEDPAAPAQLVGQLISDLSAAGASNVLVMSHLNSPRLTRPDLVDPYNAELSAVISDQRATHEGLTIYEFDVDSVLREIVASPGDYGILFLEDQVASIVVLSTSHRPL